DVSATIAIQGGNLNAGAIRAKHGLHASPVAKGCVDSVRVLRPVEHRRHIGKVVLERVGAQQSLAGAERVGHKGRMTILIDRDDLAAGHFQKSAPGLSSGRWNGVMESFARLEVAKW